MTVTADLISSSTASMQHALVDAVDRDWSVAAGDLDWSCRDTTVHVADDLFSYASQVVAQTPQGYLRIEASVEATAAPHSLLQCLVMCGELLRLAVSTAAPNTRAWHPYGTSDPEGFAAMGVTEVLVPTYDVASGLAIAWTPPRPSSAGVRCFDCSQTHHQGTHLRSCFGVPVGQLWLTDPAKRDGAGTQLYGGRPSSKHPDLPQSIRAVRPSAASAAQVA